MFWVRFKVLVLLLKSIFEYSDFFEEFLFNDGSELYVLERLLGLLVEKEGYE